VRLIAILAGVAFLVFPAAPLQAQGITDYWDRYHAPRKVKKRVKRPRRHQHRPRKEEPKRVDPDDWRCLPSMEGIGTQWATEDGALDRAEKDWMERVRYKYGERYMDISNSAGYDRDRDRECGRSSIGEVAGQTLHRCSIWARPCRSLKDKN
jgi:hypothetical protein